MAKLESAAEPARLTQVETQLLAALQQATDLIFSTDTERPWSLQAEASCQAFQNSFAEAGVDLSTVDAEEYARSLQDRPPELREAVFLGLETWELMATAAKKPDSQALRLLQTSLDDLDWRRQLRILREDNKPADVLANIKSLDLTPLNEAQLDLLGLTILVHATNVPQSSLEAIQYLLAAAPDSFVLNLSLAAELYTEGMQNTNEKARRMAAAVKPLRAAASLRGDSPAPPTLLYRAFQELGNVPAAEEQYEQANARLHRRHGKRSSLLEKPGNGKIYMERCVTPNQHVNSNTVRACSTRTCQMQTSPE